MRVVFMGTPAYATAVLSALLDVPHDVVGVYTRPDRPAGRGKRPAASPVKCFAQERGLPVRQPASLRSRQAQQELASLSPDVIVVAACGFFLPPRTLDLPPFGCLNLHPSLLPRYRGPSPVASAILNGDAVTGVAIIKLDEGMDTGPIVAHRETRVRPRENALELTTRLFQMGASLLIEIMPGWAQGRIRARPQEHSQATITRLLSRADGSIDWRFDAARIARQVLAYQPWPGSFTSWRGRVLKVIEAAAVDAEAATPSPPGMVMALPDGGVGIATGEGVLAVGRLQLEGRRAVGAREFMNGHPEFLGSTVG